MATLSSDELALLRSLASRGDKVAEILMRSFDTLRAADKEVVAVRAATTANRTLSGLTNTVLDGQTPTAGELILVKSQTDAKENGIYIAASGAWTRLLDDQGDPILLPGMIVNVRTGTTLAGTMWTCDAATVRVGTDNITFAEYTEAAAAVGVGKAGFGTPTLTVGGEDTHHIDVTIQLKDSNSANLAAKALVDVWVSDTAGAAPSAVAPSSTTTFSTGTVLKITTADVLFKVVSDATGVIVVRVTEATAKNFYVNVAGGTMVASSAVLGFAG